MNDQYTSELTAQSSRAGQILKTVALIIVIMLLFGLVGLGYICLM